jgi:hypothetical protein
MMSHQFPIEVSHSGNAAVFETAYFSSILNTSTS